MQKEINAEKVIFIIYCTILVWVVIFKTSFSFDDFFITSERSINLIPFNFILNASKAHIRETLLNLLVFIPFGLYLRMINRSTKHTILYGIVISLIFELVQFIFATGICDITDLITNSLGELSGSSIYIILLKVFRTEEKVIRTTNCLSIIILAIFFALTTLLFIANSPTQPTVC